MLKPGCLLLLMLLVQMVGLGHLQWAALPSPNPLGRRMESEVLARNHFAGLRRHYLTINLVGCPRHDQSNPDRGTCGGDVTTMQAMVSSPTSTGEMLSMELGVELNQKG